MATSKKNKNKPKLNLTVRQEQRNKLEQMASLENRSSPILSRLWPMNAGSSFGMGRGSSKVRTSLAFCALASFERP